MKSYYILLFSLFFVSCQHESKVNKKLYALKSIEIDSSVKSKIFKYLSDIKIKKSNKYPIIVCQYYSLDDNVFLLISQFEKHEYFFSERGFLKDVYCYDINSIPVVIDIEKKLKSKLSLSISNNTVCQLDFPRAWGYLSVVPDSIVPKIVKKNIKEQNKGWINYHTQVDKWLFKLSDKGSIIETSLKIIEDGVPIPN